MWIPTIRSFRPCKTLANDASKLHVTTAYEHPDPPGTLPLASLLVTSIVVFPKVAKEATALPAFFFRA